jgi:hypothetical protein
MTLVLVFIFAAVTVYAVYKSATPFLEERRDQLRSELLDEELGQIEELVARKSNLLQSLRDLEFDHETGKLADDDYERLKTRYERKAVRVMQRLDELRGEDRREAIDEAVQSRLEQIRAEREEVEPSEEQIAAKTSTSDATTAEEPADETGDATDEPETPGRACPDCGRNLPSDARFCSGCGLELDARDCPDCGRELADDAQFCSGCGRSLDGETPPDVDETRDDASPDGSDEPDDELDPTQPPEDDANVTADDPPDPTRTSSSDAEPRSQATG